MTEPFLGELRICYHHHEATLTPNGPSVGTAVRHLEQWNGKEWVFICEIR